MLSFYSETGIIHHLPPVVTSLVFILCFLNECFTKHFGLAMNYIDTICQMLILLESQLHPVYIYEYLL